MLACVDREVRETKQVESSASRSCRLVPGRCEVQVLRFPNCFKALDDCSIVGSLIFQFTNHKVLSVIYEKCCVKNHVVYH